MKEITELPSDKTLDKLIELAESAEQKAIYLYEETTKIDEKWRIKLEKRRKSAIEQLESRNIQ